MALTACPDCEEKVSTSAKACPHCGKPMAAAAAAKKRPFATKEDFVGGLLFIGGACGAVHYLVFFKTTVGTELGELHNIGLLQDRQNGLIISTIVAVVGLFVGFVGRRR